MYLMEVELTTAIMHDVWTLYHFFNNFKNDQFYYIFSVYFIWFVCKMSRNKKPAKELRNKPGKYGRTFNDEWMKKKEYNAWLSDVKDDKSRARLFKYIWHI